LRQVFCRKQLCDNFHKVAPDFFALVDAMVGPILPVLILIAVALAMSVGMVVAGKLLGPRRVSAVKLMPYESGMDPIHDTHRRFDVRFHVVAIAFLLFDVELLFLYPWAVSRTNPQGIEPAVVAVVAGPDAVAAGRAGLTADQAAAFSTQMGVIFAEVVVFILLLGLGFVYAWRKGVFQWR
jgi:NADH-quinone oxidoreductase subunit A